MKIFTFVIAVISIVSATSSTETSSTETNTTESVTSTISESSRFNFSFSPSISLSASSSIFPSASVVVSLPTQIYRINKERPKMVNQINSQRSGMNHPLLCQDSLLSSIAQQHANDMAALDDLEHDLSCSSTAFPVQFCKSSDRLAPYGQSAENILALAGNDGSAATAMAQFNADAVNFSNMMNPTYLYVGVGMAMNQVSGKYYWVQVFSAGDFQGVSCVFTPSVTVLDAFNRTFTTVQPLKGLNLRLYPRGITSSKNIDKSSGKKKLFCTMIPFAHGTGSSVLPLGQLPYPTITLTPPENIDPTMKAKVSGIVQAFSSIMAQLNGTSIDPSSISLCPMMSASASSDVDVSDSTSLTSTSTTMSPTRILFSGSGSGSFNPALMMASFTPTNEAQSSKLQEWSSMMANPTMSSALQQMAQFMMMANPSVSITSVTSTTSSISVTVSVSGIKLKLL